MLDIFCLYPFAETPIDHFYNSWIVTHSINDAVVLVIDFFNRADYGNLYTIKAMMNRIQLLS